MDHVDACVDKVYKVDQFTAMRCMRNVWDHLLMTLMANYCLHIGLIDNEVSRSMVHENYMTDIASFLTSLMPHTSRELLSVKFLVNPDGEYD